MMYHLSVNPEKQDILRKECLSVESITIKDLDKLKYLKACLLEALRLTPLLPIHSRVISEDMIVAGYHIPKDTLVLWSNNMLGMDESRFPESEKFLPERWLEHKKSIHPFAVRPFGHGPRMCIGKRFAELEIYIAMHRLMTNFQINWMSAQPLTMSQKLLNTPDQRLDFQFNDL